MPEAEVVTMTKPSGKNPDGKWTADQEDYLATRAFEEKAPYETIAEELKTLGRPNATYSSVAVKVRELRDTRGSTMARRMRNFNDRENDAMRKMAKKKHSAFEISLVIQKTRAGTTRSQIVGALGRMNINVRKLEKEARALGRQMKPPRGKAKAAVAEAEQVEVPRVVQQKRKAAAPSTDPGGTVTLRDNVKGGEATLVLTREEYDQVKAVVGKIFFDRL